MEANRQGLEKQIKVNHENGRKYAEITKTPYWNLMLDKQVMKTIERPTRHMLFLPQKVVRCEVWTNGLHKRHNFKQQSPWREMQSNIHPNEWVQYTS